MEFYINKGQKFLAIQFNRINFEELWAFTEGRVSELVIGSATPGDATCTLVSYYKNIEIQEGDYVFLDNTSNQLFALPADYFNQINEIAPQNFEPPR